MPSGYHTRILINYLLCISFFRHTAFRLCTAVLYCWWIAAHQNVDIHPSLALMDSCSFSMFKTPKNTTHLQYQQREKSHAILTAPLFFKTRCCFIVVAVSYNAGTTLKQCDLLAGTDIGAWGDGGDIWPHHFWCVSLCHLGVTLSCCQVLILGPEAMVEIYGLVTSGVSHYVSWVKKLNCSDDIYRVPLCLYLRNSSYFHCSATWLLDILWVNADIHGSFGIKYPDQLKYRCWTAK